MFGGVGGDGEIFVLVHTIPDCVVSGFLRLGLKDNQIQNFIGLPKHFEVMIFVLQYLFSMPFFPLEIAYHIFRYLVQQMLGRVHKFCPFLFGWGL